MIINMKVLLTDADVLGTCLTVVPHSLVNVLKIQMIVVIEELLVQCCYYLLVSCSDNLTCCHTEAEVADQTFYLTQSQYTDTGSTSPSADPITPGA